MTKSKSSLPPSKEVAPELAALARIITYARQSALDLNVGLTAYCLDVALEAALEELKAAGVDGTMVSSDTLTGVDSTFFQ